ncbi:MAG: alanine racemase [Amaricoccus sp.]
MARPRLVIDLDAVAANWCSLDALSGPSVETAAVVKADGYGLGAAPVATALAAAGARTFFVATAEEGAALREALGRGPTILDFGGLMRGDADLIRGYDLVPCLDSRGQVEAFARELPAGHPFALQLNSGMNRLGLDAAELAAVAERLPGRAPVLTMSHLACADEPDHPMNVRQADTFAALAARLPRARLSLAATGGILLGPRFHLDLVRPGVGLYGGLPFAAARPVVSLSLPVIQVRNLPPGAPVGYGAAWTTGRPSRIATVAAGYADGLHRAIGRGAVKLFAGDTPCALVGRVSMDLITVDVTDARDVPDALTVLDERQTVDDLAAAAGTIGYEILTSLGARYERVYKGSAQPPERP